MKINELINKNVLHTWFGKGEIFQINEKEVFVRFYESKDMLKFKFPDVFVKNFLKFEEKIDYKNIEIETAEEKSEKVKTNEELQSRNEILNKLKSFGFEGFIHTTELVNFLQIIESGCLKPRNQLTNVNFVDRADKDVIKITNKEIKDCCRFYYQYKTPTNFMAHYKTPVIIVFDQSLIFDFNSIFTNANAGSKFSEKTRMGIRAKNFNWQAIFERCPYSDSVLFEKYVYIKEKYGYDYIKHIRNAEFLMHGSVPIDKIVKVYFKRYEDMSFAQNKIYSNDIIEKFVLDRSKFN